MFHENAYTRFSEWAPTNLTPGGHLSFRRAWKVYRDARCKCCRTLQVLHENAFKHIFDLGRGEDPRTLLPTIPQSFP